MRALLLAIAAAAGCTSLGPVPAMTNTIPVPQGRTGAEIQLGAVPGYYLSSAVKEDASGAPIGQLAAWLGYHGVVLGGRYVGSDESGGYAAPVLGYRRFLDQERQLAGAAVIWGSRGEGASKGASYDATTAGVEAAFDLRPMGENKYAEVHFLATLSATILSASGTYCQDMDLRFGVDCPDPPMPPTNVTTAEGSGLYPAAAIGIAIDGGRHLGTFFHGARLAGHLAAGTQPRVESGEQTDFGGWASFGLSLTIGFGAR
jgi:hypothetical protein